MFSNMGNFRKIRTVFLTAILSGLATSMSASNASEDGWMFVDEFRVKDSDIDYETTGSVSRRYNGESYCINILDEAKETRNAILTERLTELESQVDRKLDLMAERIAVLKTWTEKREKFLEKTNDSLIQIFQSMRPDAAASQLTEIGPAMSASIIAKLEPKYSSAILTEMKASDAAQITVVLTKLAAQNDVQ